MNRPRFLGYYNTPAADSIAASICSVAQVYESAALKGAHRGESNLSDRTFEA